ncbi:uncharacterized protein LOC127241574 isoform X2 [Andrographis paniculata]|uniref:uncharacterized protein LOC127241574 isoform X2 n=1 Tax=Andrographis paniculata TaxID=175694 RepID=UPI0021E87A5D|nr:uncharacterized protein LOC127241574 isoform X2 [Andrographis paniculata]
MAEDDDDETFGDFAFAPFQSTSKSTAPISSAADDWGDFLTSPQQSQHSDPPAPDKSATWTKPRGALPLSIFGGVEEEEEEKGVSGVAWGLDQRESGVNGGGDFNSNLGGKDVPNSRNIDIADLYNRYPQTDSAGAAASVGAEVSFRSNQNASGSAVTELNDKGRQEGQTNNGNRDEDLFGSWSQGFYGAKSNLNARSPNMEMSNADSGIREKNQQQDGFNDGGDDEWEFMDADSEKVNKNEMSNGSVPFSANVTDSSKSHDLFGASNGSSNFFSQPTESVDYFASSSGISALPIEMNFFGDQKGAVASPNGWTSDAKSIIEPTAIGSEINQSPGVVIEDFDEDFGEFTGASADIDLKSEEVSTNDVFSPSKGAEALIPDGKMQVDFMVPEVSKRNVNSSGSVVFGDSNGSIDLFATSAKPVDFFATSSSVSSTSKEVDLFGLESTAPTGYNSYTNSNIEQIKVNDTPNHAVDFDAADTDEDFGDFTAAAAETGLKLGVYEAAESSNSFMSPSNSKESVDVFKMSNEKADFFGMPSKSDDCFAPSNGIYRTSQEVDLSGVHKNSEIANGFTPGKNTTVEHIDSTLNHSPDVKDLEFDDDFGDFTAADTGSVTMENNTKLKSQKGAIPLSIFGGDEYEDEESQREGSLDVQDVFKNQSSSDQRNSHTSSPVFSINDLISSLYSQAEEASSMNALEKPTDTEESLSNSVSSSNVNHIEGGVWDFNDAPQTRGDSEAFLNVVEGAHLDDSSQMKFKNYLDFYHKLAEELCFVINRHIENLWDAGDSASISGGDTRAASLEIEFQMVSKELEQLNLPVEESTPPDYPSDERLRKFVEVLLKPQFQILESEYNLSSKLLLAEKDTASAMELIKHATTMLKILSMGTVEDRKVYFSVWNQMIHACAQELKHGALIWNQAAAKQVQSQLLSESKGSEYILGLGEIYKAVAVLGASSRLYKPWTFSHAADFPDVYTLVDECLAMWLSSGLEEALSSVSPSSSSSAKLIVSLDNLALQKYVYSKTEPSCQISLLSADAVPGATIVVWDDQRCMVKLVNLWANLVSRNPPDLPQQLIHSS